MAEDPFAWTRVRVHKILSSKYDDPATIHVEKLGLHPLQVDFHVPPAVYTWTPKNSPYAISPAPLERLRFRLGGDAHTREHTEFQLPSIERDFL